MINAAVTPSILIDIKKNRIRIHKKTIHALGDPKYVLLLVNPKEATVGVLCSGRERNAHRIPQATMDSKQCYEIYSTTLMHALREVCPNFHGSDSYRMFGEILPEKGIAVFTMSNAVLRGDEKEDEL